MRSVGSLAGLVATAVGCGSASSPRLGLLLGPPSSASSTSSASMTLMPMSLSMARMSSICSEVDLLGGEDGVQLVIGDKAALLRGLDHLLDGGVGKVEERPVRCLDRGRRFRFFVFLDLGRHSPLSDTKRPAPHGVSTPKTREPDPKSHIRRVAFPRIFERAAAPNQPVSPATAPPLTFGKRDSHSYLISQRPRLTAGRRSESLDQGFHTFGIGELLLDIDEPRKIRLARFASERGLRILELLM